MYEIQGKIIDNVYQTNAFKSFLKDFYLQASHNFVLNDLLCSRFTKLNNTPRLLTFLQQARKVKRSRVLVGANRNTRTTTLQRARPACTSSGITRAVRFRKTCALALPTKLLPRNDSMTEQSWFVFPSVFPVSLCLFIIMLLLDCLEQ